MQQGYWTGKSQEHRHNGQGNNWDTNIMDRGTTAAGILDRGTTAARILDRGATAAAGILDRGITGTQT